LLPIFEQLGQQIAKPSVKQRLAAIRQLFEYLITGGILELRRHFRQAPNCAGVSALPPASVLTLTTSLAVSAAIIRPVFP
jgi:hypothetical protein